MKDDKNRILILRTVAFIFLLGVSLISASCSRSCSGPKQNSVVEGRLIDLGGRPVSQYAIRIEGVDSGAVSSVAFTDFSGNFQFLNLPAGKYRIYPLDETADQGQVVEVLSGKPENIGAVTLRREIEIEVNKDAARTINASAAQVINPEAAKTINPEAAKTINFEAAKMINPEAAKTINPEAAKTINPAAAKVLNPQRAMVLTKEQATTITPEEASKPLSSP